MGKLARITVPASAPEQTTPPPRYYAEAPAREITPEHVQTELTRLALANVADIISVSPEGTPSIDLSSASRESLAAISSIQTTHRTIYNSKGDYLGEETTTRVQLNDKLRALELAGKTLGMFKPVEVHMTMDLADRLLAARQRLLEHKDGL